MEKKVLQDIVAPEARDPKKGPTRKWNYDNGNFGIVKNNKTEEEPVQDSVEEDEESEDMPGEESKTEIKMEAKKEKESYTNSYYNDKGRTKREKRFHFSLAAWIVGGVVLAVIIFVAGWTFFSTATVKVVLTQQTTTINDTFSAMQSGGTGGDVTYQIIKLQDTVTQDVKPTGEKEVQNKATGKIVIYGQDEKSLKLVANTRFQSPDGKIYRIDKPVVVPAATKDTSGKSIQGSVEVTVFADQPGDTYNIGIVDFTIPGLVGTDLEKKYSARGTTEMTGGYSGTLKYASDTDIQAASSTMQEAVKEKLLSNIASSVGEDNVLYTDATFIDFKTNIPTSVSENGMLKVEEVGLLQAFVFNRKELSEAIAKKSLNPYDGSPVVVKNLDDFAFTFEKKDTFTVSTSNMFSFTLAGDPHIVWEVDETSLKNDLAGLNKNNIATIVKDHPSIRRIEANIKPFWKSSFPDNPNAITIEEVLE